MNRDNASDDNLKNVNDVNVWKTNCFEVVLV